MVRHKFLQIALALFLAEFLCFQTARPCIAADVEPAGTKSDWHGFTKYDFVVDGRTCYLVTPKTAAPGRPWIWRALFFGHEPQADIALLEQGFHLTYCDVSELYGSPTAVKHWDAFYKYATTELNLAPKMTLEGLSRGGLIIYNWAAANPEKVACIYGDAPVCDFKSWPAAKYPKGPGMGKPRAAEWGTLLKAYGMTEAEALKFGGNPVDNLKPLAAAKIPLLHVVGDDDDVVPVSENTAIIEARYKELGGLIEVIHKPGVGHHPHSLKDPAPIVEFILKQTQIALGEQTVASAPIRNVSLRGSFDRCRTRFEKKGAGHVAFIGGSITEMNGYRPMVCKILQTKFPDTKFTFTDAGISSTCSTTGAFRLERDVLSQGPVDLFFIEFAVNDDQDAFHARRDCIRGLEGIIRHVRKHNPQADLVVTYFVNPEMLKQLQAGKSPLSIDAHDTVCRHYGISTIHLAQEVADQITAGELTWEKFGGTHPAPFGNAICAQMIEKLLVAAWAKPLSAETELNPHELPSPLDTFSYSQGRFVEPTQAQVEAGWEWKVPEWEKLAGSKRDRFVKDKMLVAEKPGAQFSLAFEGSTVGAYVVAGPDAGILDVSVDGGDFRPVDLYHRFSSGLHYPRTVILATDLAPGPHQLVVRVSEKTKSKGTSARIMQFGVNGRPETKVDAPAR